LIKTHLYKNKKRPLVVFFLFLWGSLLICIIKKLKNSRIKILETKVKSEDEICYIRNQFANPISHYSDSSQWMSFVLKRKRGDSDLMWKMTADQFEDFGVKQIFIGSAELYSNEDSAIYGGCLGEALDRLKENFRIEYSRMTWQGKF